MRWRSRRWQPCGSASGNAQVMVGQQPGPRHEIAGLQPLDRETRPLEQPVGPLVEAAAARHTPPSGRQPALPAGERRRPGEAVLDEVQRPPGTSTLRASRSAASGSGMLHSAQVTTTVSMLASASGRCSADCSSRRTGKGSHAPTFAAPGPTGRPPGRPPADRQLRGRRAAGSGRPRCRSRARGRRRPPRRAAVAAGGARPSSRAGSAAGRRPSRRSPILRPG